MVVFCTDLTTVLKFQFHVDNTGMNDIVLLVFCQLVQNGFADYVFSRRS